MESKDIKYNNTLIISLISIDDYNKSINLEKEEKKDALKLNINKYFYKFINTFNLKILLNYLTKNNIYKLTNSSNEIITSFTGDIPNYSSIFIKDKIDNLDNIILLSNVRQDSYPHNYNLLILMHKIKYLLNNKIFV